MKRNFLLLFSLICIISLILFSHKVINFKSDYRIYFLASKNIFSSKNIYLSNPGYKYPLLFAFLIFPTTFNWYFSAFFFFILNTLFLFLLLKLSNLTFPEIDYEKIFYTLILLFLPLCDTLSLGQVNIIVILTFFVSLYFLKKRKNFLSSIFYSISCLIKPFYFPFLIYFLIKKKFKFLLYSILNLFFFLFLFPAIFLGFKRALSSQILWIKIMILPSIFLKPIPGYEYGAFNIKNYSLSSIFRRFFTPLNLSLRGKTLKINILNLSNFQTFLILGLILFSILIFTIFFTFKFERKLSIKGLSIFTFFSSFSLPIFWFHYLSYLFIPALYLSISLSKKNYILFILLFNLLLSLTFFPFGKIYGLPFLSLILFFMIVIKNFFIGNQGF